MYKIDKINLTKDTNLLIMHKLCLTWKWMYDKLNMLGRFCGTAYFLFLQKEFGKY